MNEHTIYKLSSFLQVCNTWLCGSKWCNSDDGTLSNRIAINESVFQNISDINVYKHTLSLYRGADELFLSIQPVVSLHHSGHRRGEVVFENDLACAVTASVDLEQEDMIKRIKHWLHNIS